MAVTQSLVPLTPLRMAMALALMVIMALASAKLRLGLEKNIFIGSFRTTAQLLVLGLLLHPIFLENKPWIVLLYLALMILLAARECYARPRFEYRGMWGRILLTMLLSTFSTAAWGFFLVLGFDPWWDAMYVIPITGMLLGNTINGITLANDSILTELCERRDRLERNLAMGATVSEATSEAARIAVRTGITPVLNSMSVIGLVSIPGMMTGQILGGTTPMQAALYQMMIMFLIAFNVMFATVLTTTFAIAAAFDSRGRIQHGLIRRRAGKKLDLVVAAVRWLCTCCSAEAD